MPINVLVRRLPEVGRIRMGAKGTRGEPKRLDSFRLTSQDKQLLQAAAALYGGAVKPWEGAFELITEVKELPILLVPQMPPSQWFELWNAGGCQRRCDGLTEMLSDSECKCDPDRRECKMTTRISVMLPDLPGIGVWRFESHGYYAATELPTTLELLLSEARRNRYPAAALAIEQRVVKRDGQTKKFPVAAIRIRETLGFLIGSQNAPAVEQRQVSQISAGHTALPAAPPPQIIDEPPAPPEPTPEESRKNEWDRLIQTEGWLPATDDKAACCEFISSLIGRKVAKLADLTTTDVMKARIELEERARGRKRWFALLSEFGQEWDDDRQREKLSEYLRRDVSTRKTLTATDWAVVNDKLDMEFGSDLFERQCDEYAAEEAVTA